MYNGVLTIGTQIIPVVLKLFLIPDNITSKSQNSFVNDDPIIKDKNEIGMTHYISDFILEEQMIDNKNKRRFYYGL